MTKPRVVALTGGIGAGKSSVGRILAELGAVVVDADDLARDAIAAGSSGADAVVAAFGTGVLTRDGSIDRTRLAERAFADLADRRALEHIVHPLVAEAAAKLFVAARPDQVLVYEIPLLAETDSRAEFACVVVVDAPDEIRLARLVARGMSADEARARMSAQATSADRLKIADYVIDNSGSTEDLRRRTAELWPVLVSDEKAVGGSG